MREWFPVVIIGAGQAGLSAAGELARSGWLPGQDFALLDAADGPGGAWRHRWDSLTLARAHRVADLPGFPLGQPDPTTPASRVVADYYGAYEHRLDLGVIRPATVTTVTGVDPHTLLVEFSHDGVPQQVPTSRIINATGTWTQPFWPAFPGRESFRGWQLHTADYRSKEDFRGKRTLVIGAGASAVQFLLELAPVTDTLWATRRPPRWSSTPFDDAWGRDVEKRVLAREVAGLPPRSVVATTGLALTPEVRAGLEAGILTARPMPLRLHPTGAEFAEGFEPLDVVFWNTGFRPALRHLAPLRLREPGGGIRMLDEVRVARDPRVLLVGYGSSSSTVGARRAGRKAALAVRATTQR
ncbi:NAD(P)/FAD-dependent oxidoreductase [Corynebacterium sp. c6VSa_13]|uniref:NAD(P)-binding domain-containing protein n=1 Tax=Corynebacterium sp. c6VSa_13 TaxID=2913496 RepID=UPI0022BA6B03|nr:NAD(P)-binding domain-containing protein [Corynebacterium sp. c6VSa_13]MCZ9309679.1 NAD(P)/FAD-dependent oxidoreductase [Corynebacterium sp. c6VSa_13]